MTSVSSESQLKEQYDLETCCRDSCCRDIYNARTALTNTQSGSIVSGVVQLWAMFDKVSHLKGSSLLRIMTTSQIWTGIFLVTMVAFMTIRTMIRIKRHGRVLPLLKTISDGPFSSTRTGAEGIILPLLNYRRTGSTSTLSKTRKHQTVKERHEKNDTEILNAMKLIEQHKVKFIEEDPSSGREERNKEERQIVYTLDLHTDNVYIFRIHY